MAIDPHRREKLLERATVYRRRLWLRLPVPASWLAVPPSNVIASQWCSSFSTCSTWELFVGCRQNGGWSLYFDLEPVLQFNPQGQLRRLHAAAALLQGQQYTVLGNFPKLTYLVAETQQLLEQLSTGFALAMSAS